MWQKGLYLATQRGNAIVEADYSTRSISILSDSDFVIQKIKEELESIAQEGKIKATHYSPDRELKTEEFWGLKGLDKVEDKEKTPPIHGDTFGTKTETPMDYKIRIKNALAALENASKAVYFEEMNAVVEEYASKITTTDKYALARFERRFMHDGEKDSEFVQQLELFAKKLRDYLMKQDEVEVQLIQTLDNLPATTKEEIVAQVSEVKEVKGATESSKARQIFNTVMEKLAMAGISIGGTWAMGFVLQSLGIDKETITTFMEIFKAFSDNKE
jgi:ABC-type multidrug transport system fused ATPase/permease subunit